MAHVIRVLRAKFRHSGRHRDGWISMFGYTTAENLESARRFTKREDAESFALLLVVKVPDYIGKLKIVTVVWDDGWKVKKEAHADAQSRLEAPSKDRTVRK